MSHIKPFKKLKIFVLSTSLILSSGVTTICYCGRHKEVIEGQTFTFANSPRVQAQIGRLQISLRSRKEENPGITPPIIFGGRYKSVPHTLGYESHHLISANFCRIHGDIIEVKNAPAVLILKDIHKNTGSYGGDSEKYLELEEEAFRQGGLQAVLELGIKNLRQVINEYYTFSRIPVLPISPFKRAQAMLKERDSNAYPGEDLTAFVTTPLKPKVQSRL